MNEQTPTWRCPKCSRYINSYDDLFVDGYFQDLLETVGKNVDIVRIGASGELQQVKEEPDMSDSSSTPDPSSSHSVKRSASTATEPAITILDDDDDAAEIAGTDIVATKGIKRRASQEFVFNSSPMQRPRPNVIDLTLSDDDDEAEEENNNYNNNIDGDRGNMDPSDNNIRNETIDTATTTTTTTITTGQLIAPRAPSPQPPFSHPPLPPMPPMPMIQQQSRPMVVIAPQPPNTSVRISTATGTVLATSQNTSNNTITTTNNNVNTAPSS